MDRSRGLFLGLLGPCLLLALHGCEGDSTDGTAGAAASGVTAGSGGSVAPGGNGGAGGEGTGGASGGAGGAVGGAGGSVGGSGGSAGGAGGAVGGAGGSVGGSGGSAGGAEGGGSAAGGSGGSGGSASLPECTTDAVMRDGLPNRVLLIGTVVTPTTSYDGQVLVEGDTITCAEAGTACATEPGAVGATVVATCGIIAPGLIDTHNHILYDIFDGDDWLPHIPSSCTSAQDCVDGSSYCTLAKCDCVDNVCKYKNHNHWTAEDEYAQMGDYKQCLEDASQGKPIWCPQTYEGTGSLKCEMDKWGELKGMVAGTTSIVGLPGTSSACFGSLSRSIDVAQNDLGYDKIQTSALFPPSSPDGVCANFADGDTEAFLVHCGEGVDPNALNEFTTLATITDPDGCLYSWQTAITHGTAYGTTEFDTMASHSMKLTWSPASNVALYGTTTNIPAALAEGVLISIAPDWSMGGSQNMLDELRFADAWDDARWGNVLSAQDLVEMATVNAATVLALQTVIGSIAVGMKADLFVVGGDPLAPYDAILAARPSDVRLVMVGGAVLFGDDELAAAGPATPGCESIDICGTPKFLCVAENDSSNKLNQTHAQIKSALEQGLSDLDGIMPFDPVVDCEPDCAADEECYARASILEVDPSNCGSTCCDNPSSCDPLESCFQITTGPPPTYGCRSANACAPIRTETFAPLSPLVRCP